MLSVETRSGRQLPNLKSYEAKKKGSGMWQVAATLVRLEQGLELRLELAPVLRQLQVRLRHFAGCLCATTLLHQLNALIHGLDVAGVQRLDFLDCIGEQARHTRGLPLHHLELGSQLQAPSGGGISSWGFGELNI